MKLNYGDRLRLAREHKNLTQEQLAEKSGVKQGTISKIERGDQQSSGFDAELAFCLDVHAMWLKTGRNEFEPDWITQGLPKEIKEETTSYTVTKKEKQPEPTPQAIEFAKLFDTITHEQQTAINVVIHAFINSNNKSKS